MQNHLTAPPVPAPTTRSFRNEGAWPARAVIACIGLQIFAVASVVAGALDPGYDPLREGISALAATTSPSAAVMIGGFLALAVGTISAGLALWSRLSRGTAGRIGAGLVLLADAGMVVVALARQDCSELIGACTAAERAGTLSGHHVLHQLVSLAVFAALIAALFVLPRGLRRNHAWARWAVPTRLAGLAALVALVALLRGTSGDLGGLVQRAFIALVLGWPVLLAALPGRTTLP
jgi:hypothetical protein